MILRKRTWLNIATNFAAYWRLKAQPSTLEGELLADLQGAAQRGDREKFWLDMRLVYEGRSFLFTRNGYYVLGPSIAKPGDICSVLFGVTVPFISRKADGASHYKLVGEAYIHGLMRGEAVNNIRKDEQREEFIVC
jgi:hypothetical protein